MATLVRVQAQWGGFVGAPGYTNWYGISDGDSAAAANALGTRMRAFFLAIQAHLPTGVDVKVQRLYQVINDVNGNITGEANMASDPAVVNGSGGSAAYAAPAGACVNWETGHFNDNGRRVRGRTYLVPLIAFTENDGSISSAALSTIQTAGTAALGGTGSLGVWTRPSPGGSDGTFNIAIAALVKDKVAVLTSRRD